MPAAGAQPCLGRRVAVATTVDLAVESVARLVAAASQSEFIARSFTSWTSHCRQTARIPRCSAIAERLYGACCVMVIGVPVIVKIATRTGPMFAATANWTIPSPAPEAPCVTVRKLALLVAVHVQVFDVLTEIEAEPPEAGNVVVVTPVMIWQPIGGPVVGPVEELEFLSPQAAAKSNPIAERVASVCRERCQMLMAVPVSTDRSRHVPFRSIC